MISHMCSLSAQQWPRPKSHRDVGSLLVGTYPHHSPEYVAAVAACSKYAADAASRLIIAHSANHMNWLVRLHQSVDWRMCYLQLGAGLGLVVSLHATP